MSESSRSPPPNWAADEFTEYLDTARENQFATFVNKAIIRDLILIDSCFQQVKGGWINPKPLIPTFFMHRAHSAYRAALGAAMAGQAFEVFPLLRSCLECSAYGLHVGQNDDLAETWLRRHDDASAKNRMITRFSSKEFRNTIRVHSAKMEKIFDELYERTIDFGGHPNERAFFSNMAREENEDRVEFQMVLLHGDGRPLEHALKSTGQVGLWALHAFQLLYPERFMLLGVSERLEEFRDYY